MPRLDAAATLGRASLGSDERIRPREKLPQRPRFELTLLVLLSRWTRAGIIHARAPRAPACERRAAAAGWRVLVQPSVPRG
eukprot:scaffold70405_cov69-Phaeocystis_antarctica.AAC.3